MIQSSLIQDSFSLAKMIFNLAIFTRAGHEGVEIYGPLPPLARLPRLVVATLMSSEYNTGIDINPGVHAGRRYQNEL